MIRIVDKFLDRTTMYRLTVYYLSALLLLGVILGAAGVLRASALAIVWTSAELIGVSWLTGIVASRVFRIPANKESALITGLILALIAEPVWVLDNPAGAGVLALVAVVAILSKYLIPPGRQHIFNPAAFGAFFAGIVFNQYASWWVGTAAMLPLVALGGVLILRKTARFRMVGLFFGFFIVFFTGVSLIQGFDISMYLLTLKIVFVNTQIVFFAVIMLTEPATSPKRFRWRAVYSAIVAFLLLPQLNVGGFSFTPELALLIGNLFSYFTIPGYKTALQLVEKRKIGTDTLEFVFTRPEKFRHEAGQFMEWTLPIRKADSRGNRRYFTIASGPNEETIRIAARFFEHPSAYKDGLAGMQPGDTIAAADLAGDFILPADESLPLVFIAGGIGITPFRSMIAHMRDTGERRKVTLFYSNYREDEIAYRELFCDAEKKVGLTTVYTLTDPENIPAEWTGHRGFVNAAMIQEEVPDYRNRLFYISGSRGMVEHVRRELRNLGIRPGMIRTDFFPGYLR